MPRLAPVAAATAALALLSLLHLSAALPAPHPSRRLPGRIATSLALRRSCPGTQALHLSAAARLRGGDGEDEGEAPAGEGGEESQAEGGAPGQEGAPVAEGAVGEDAVAEAGEAETSGDAVVGGIVEPAGDLRVRRAAFGIVTGSRSKVATVNLAIVVLPVATVNLANVATVNLAIALLAAGLISLFRFWSSLHNLEQPMGLPVLHLGFVVCAGEAVLQLIAPSFQKGVAMSRAFAGDLASRKSGVVLDPAALRERKIRQAYMVGVMRLVSILSSFLLLLAPSGNSPSSAVAALRTLREKAETGGYALMAGLLRLAGDSAALERLQELAGQASGDTAPPAGTADDSSVGPPQESPGSGHGVWALLLKGGVVPNIFRLGGLTRILGAKTPKLRGGEVKAPPQDAAPVEPKRGWASFTGWMQLRKGSGGSDAVPEVAKPKDEEVAVQEAGVFEKRWGDVQRLLEQAGVSAEHIAKLRRGVEVWMERAAAKGRTGATVGVGFAMVASAVVSALRVRVVSRQAARVEGFPGEGEFYLSKAFPQRQVQLDQMLISAIEDQGIRRGFRLPIAGAVIPAVGSVITVLLPLVPEERLPIKWTVFSIGWWWFFVTWTQSYLRLLEASSVATMTGGPKGTPFAALRHGRVVSRLSDEGDAISVGMTMNFGKGLGVSHRSSFPLADFTKDNGAFDRLSFVRRVQEDLVSELPRIRDLLADQVQPTYLSSGVALN
ncbi:hypothetical protein T484DRAFT_1886018 [Baffinella frigidus]|nr:hypothetical protein T484DRAFT_1886018 [Cryptophyta sp. CCMP2293]